MRKSAKLGLAIATGALLLVPATARWSSSEAGLFDPENWTKAGLKEVFGRALQRRLTIDGDLDIDFGSTLRIIANEVAVENVDWASAPYLLRIDRLTFAIDLVQLAAGDIVIEEVHLEDPEVFVERNEQGAINWRTVLAGEVVEEPPATAEESGDNAGRGGGIPAIEDLLIQGARIRYIDRLEDLAVQARLDRLAGTTGTGEKPAQLAGTGAIAGAALAIDLEAGSLDAEPGGGEVPVELVLELADTRVALTGTATDLFGLQGLDLRASLRSENPDRLLRIVDRPHPELPSLALSGQITHSDAVWGVHGLEARLGESTLSGDARFVDGEPTSLIEADLHAERLVYGDFDALVTLVQDADRDDQEPPRAGAPAEDAALPAAVDGLPRFDISFMADEILGPDLILDRLSLAARREQGAPILDLMTSGRFAGAPVAAAIQAGQNGPGGSNVYPVAAELGFASSSVQLQGTVDDPLSLDGVDLRFAADGERPLRILRAVGMTVPELPPTSLSGRLLLEDQLWRVSDMAMEAGRSDLAGDLRLDLAGARPAIDLDLYAERLVYADLQKIVAAAEALGGAGKGAEGPDGEDPQLMVFEGSNPQLNPAALPEVEADLHLAVARFEAPEMTLRDVRLGAELHDDLPRLAFKAAGEYRDEPLDVLIRLGAGEPTGAGTGYPITIRLDAPANSLALEGAVANPIPLRGVDLELEVRSSAPGRWLDLIGLGDYRLERVLGTAHLVQENATWRLSDFYAEVGESNLFGELVADLSGERPRVEGTLTSNRLIVDDFMPSSDQPPTRLAADETPVVAGPGLEPRVLPDIEADLALTVEYLKAEQVRLDNLTLDLALRNRVPVIDLAAEGRLQDEPVRMTLRAGAPGVAGAPADPYPVELEVLGAQTSVRAAGTIADPRVMDGLDVDVRLAGPTLDRLGEIVQLGLPATPPYRLSSSLARNGRRWTLTGLDGRIGDSDLAGDVTVDLGAERPTLVAELRSRTLDFDDLGPLVGVAPDAEGDEAASERQERRAAFQAADRRLLPDEPIDLSELRSIDARVTFTGEQVIAPNLPLEQVRLELVLEDGRLRLEPAEFGMADGALAAKIALDARDKPLESRFDIVLRNLKLNQFLKQFEVEIAGLEVEREGRGTLHGRATLETRGNTLHEMAASADGRVTLVMDGGRINALLVEAAGLDVGEILAVLLGGEPGADMVPLECFIGNFRIEQGVMRPRPLVLKATNDTIFGTGSVDLGEETFDLTLEAEPSDASVLSASTPIRIEGRWTDPTIIPVTDELVAKGLAAVGLGIVLPIIGATIPFIEIGEDADSRCARLLADAREVD